METTNAQKYTEISVYTQLLYIHYEHLQVTAKHVAIFRGLNYNG